MQHLTRPTEPPSPPRASPPSCRRGLRSPDRRPVDRHDRRRRTTASATSGAPSGTGRRGEVTLVTHDSFVVDEQLLATSSGESGLTVTVLAQGDAGAMVNQLLLTQSNPLGDAVFGIDNTFASKALEAGRVRSPTPRRRPPKAPSRTSAWLTTG